MFGLLKSLFGKLDAPTMENVKKHMNDCLDFLQSSEGFAKDYWQVECFQKKPSLRGDIEWRVEKDLQYVLAQPDIYRTFRELIINTIKVCIIHEKLACDNYEDNEREILFNSIHKGILRTADNEAINSTMNIVEAYENYAGSEFCYEKSVQEAVFAYIKLQVLRMLQMQIFERVETRKPDWWDDYQEAFNIYVKEYYSTILKYGADHQGFPHPMVGVMGCEQLIQLEELNLIGAVKP